MVRAGNPVRGQILSFQSLCRYFPIWRRPTQGIPTAHAHPLMSNLFPSDEPYVWPDANGKVRGVAIKPLYEGVTKAIRSDENLYKLLALADVIRVGKVRERKVAIEELKKMILHEPSREHHADQSRIKT